MGEKGLLLPVRDNRVADVAEVRSPKSKRDLNAHRHVFCLNAYGHGKRAGPFHHLTTLLSMEMV
jgi:hypothetical protein